MVTTRNTSYSPEAQESVSTTPVSARTAKRRAANMEPVSASATSKKRKVEHGRPQKITVVAAAPKQATRIRFGSEEPAVIPVQVVKDTDAEDEEEEEARQQEDEEDDSDDEAPEDISASAAQLRTEEAEAATVRAIEKQQAIERRKRQARNTKLETQATEKQKKESAKPPKAPKPEDMQVEETGSESDDEGDDEDEDEEEEGPELLPEELLAASFVRPPTPPPADAFARSVTKNKVIKLDDAPPKDRKIGPVVVSVLPKANKLLPPKGTGPSMNLREKWLAGKRKGQGKGAGFAVERKAFGGGFVKR